MNDETHDNETPEPSTEHVATPSAPDLPDGTQLSAPDGEANGGIAGPAVSSSDTVEAAPSWRPADYYAAPRSASRFPRWVPLTCGVAAILALAFMVVVGAFLRSGGLAKIVAISFGQLNSEASRMFAEDVDPAARVAFSKSLLSARDAIADGRIALADALPLLQGMQRATLDGKLSADEVEDLTASFRKSLDAPEPTSVPGEPPVVDL